MTTFAYEVSGFRRQDGTHLVKIRMTHRRKVVRKQTPIYVTREQLSRDGRKVKDAAVLAAIDRHLTRLRTAVANIEGAEWMDAERLWQVLTEQAATEKGFRLDVYEFAERMTEGMERRTRLGYKYTLNALKKFTGRDRLDINEVTFEMLAAWKAWIEARNGKGSRAVSYYLEHLKTVHSEARSLYNDDDVGVVRIPRQPFRKGLIPPQPKTRHRALTAAQTKAIAAVQLSQGSQAELARDVFMLSLAMIGENTIDLYHATEDELKDGIQTYNRRKTDSVRQDNALMKVRIEPEAERLIERYRATDGHHLLNFHTRYSGHKNFNNMVNKGLKDVAEAVNAIEGGERVPEGLNFYYARHTWSTLAMNACGFDFDTVHQALNHARRGADRVTGIYVERDFTKAWEANRKVLDLLK